MCPASSMMAAKSRAASGRAHRWKAAPLCPVPWWNSPTCQQTVRLMVVLETLAGECILPAAKDETISSNGSTSPFATAALSKALHDHIAVISKRNSSLSSKERVERGRLHMMLARCCTLLTEQTEVTEDLEYAYCSSCILTAELRWRLKQTDIVPHGCRRL